VEEEEGEGREVRLGEEDRESVREVRGDRVGVEEVEGLLLLKGEEVGAGGREVRADREGLRGADWVELGEGEGEALGVEDGEEDREGLRDVRGDGVTLKQAVRDKEEEGEGVPEGVRRPGESVLPTVEECELVTRGEVEEEEQGLEERELERVWVTDKVGERVGVWVEEREGEEVMDVDLVMETLVEELRETRAGEMVTEIEVVMVRQEVGEMVNLEGEGVRVRKEDREREGDPDVVVD